MKQARCRLGFEKRVDAAIYRSVSEDQNAGYATALDAAATFGIGPLDQLMPKDLSAAQRAIQLDPQDGEAYTALGSVQTIYL